MKFSKLNNLKIFLKNNYKILVFYHCLKMILHGYCNDKKIFYCAYVLNNNFPVQLTQFQIYSIIKSKLFILFFLLI